MCCSQVKKSITSPLKLVSGPSHATKLYVCCEPPPEYRSQLCPAMLTLWTIGLPPMGLMEPNLASLVYIVTE